MAERLPDGPAAAVDRPARGRISEIVVIARGTGGVGKSNPALNLGLCPASTGNSPRRDRAGRKTCRSKSGGGGVAASDPADSVGAVGSVGALRGR